MYDPNIPDSELLTPIIYDNVTEYRFQEDEIRQSELPEVRAGWTQYDGWLHFSTEFSDSEQSSIGPEGTRRFVRYGFITATLYGKSDTGVFNHDILADKIRQGFESKRFDDPAKNVSVITGPMRYSAAGGDEGVFVSVCVIQFEFDEIK